VQRQARNEAQILVGAPEPTTRLTSSFAAEYRAGAMRSRGGPATLAVLLAAVALACGRHDEAAFTRQVAERIRAAHPEAKVAITAPLTIEVTAKEGTMTLSLDNLWRLCERGGEECDGAVERTVRSFTQGHTFDNSAVATANVRAVLKDRGWIESAAQLALKGPKDKAESNTIVSRPFAADIWIAYVFDLPDGMRMLTRGDLAQLGLDEDRLHALALANLEEALTDIPYEPLGDGSSVRVVKAGDSYEASRILLHGRWAALAREVKGDLLVAAPARDVVLFTGSREDVAMLRYMSERLAAQQDHPISTTILRWTPKGWEVLDKTS